MGDKTAIEWTDATWNPVRGCSRVSEGCRNCYAERVAARFSGPGKPYHGLAVMQPTGPKWTGKVRLVEEHIEDPLRWKRPRRVFVNSMSDLFHEELRDEEIDRVFGIMRLAGEHTFQVLTKRAERMHRYSETAGRQGSTWPLPNVWLGVSVENQAAADERIPELLRTPAAVRFLSVEPQIGPVDLWEWLEVWGVSEPDGKTDISGIDWVIVGGESGGGARPFDIQWARSIVRQCKDAGVKCFVKQLGAKPRDRGCAPPSLHFQDRKGGDPAEWPADLRVRQFPGVRP